MNYLLSPDAQDVLHGISSEHALIVLDFDGTLAPIVQQPPLAKMTESVAAELERLSSLVPVAIISGRELDDLRQRIPAGVSFLIGDHGNEGLDAITVDADSCRYTCADWIQQLRRLADIHAAGVYLEPKGFTLSVHYRLATDHAAIESRLTAAFAGLLPAPRVVGGKCVFNLIPPGAVCKDDAMRALVKLTQPRHIVYIGDDDSDELVFAIAAPDWITVRVGYWKQSQAKYYLRSQSEIRDLLLMLNVQLDTKPSDAV